MTDGGPRIFKNLSNFQRIGGCLGRGYMDIIIYHQY